MAAGQRFVETLATPRLLVIGGTGFIGHHLLAAVHKDWRVTSISLGPPSPLRFVDSVRYLQLDLTDADAVKNSLSEEYEYVVNLSGYIDHSLFKSGGRRLINAHFDALQNLVEVLPRDSLKRFVQIGSSDEYGNAPAPQHEGLREQPISPYSLGKVASTHFLQMLHRTEGFPAVILRLFLTYGPGQEERRFLPQIIKGCLSDLEFSTSEGQQLRDFCYVHDTVRAILLALKSEDAEGHILNVASGIPVTIRAMVDEVSHIVGRGSPQYGKVSYRPDENMTLYADIQKAQDILNWTPEVSLSEGLKQTINWMMQAHA